MWALPSTTGRTRSPRQGSGGVGTIASNATDVPLPATVTWGARGKGGAQGRHRADRPFGSGCEFRIRVGLGLDLRRRAAGSRSASWFRALCLVSAEAVCG